MSTVLGSEISVFGIVGIFHANHRQEEVFWTAAVATQLKVNFNALKDFADRQGAAMVDEDPFRSFLRTTVAQSENKQP